MTAAPAPSLSASKPLAPPTSLERQATWSAIIVSLGAFWYGAGIAATALWGAFVG